MCLTHYGRSKMKHLRSKGLVILISGLFGLLFSAGVYSCTAFYESETTDGMNKICYYNHLGSGYAVTFQAYELCPLTIQARH